jgi:FixJ family two-component response regulator
MAAEPTVFVVDDDPGMRRSLSWLLQSVSLQVETFASGEEFLAAYDPGRPGCLLLDVRMPGMSGVQLQVELARRRATLPIIFLSGYAEVRTAVRTLKMGAVDFLEKPFSDEELLDLVLRTLERERRARLADAQRAAAVARLALLSRRECEVMRAVVAGKPNKATAFDLGISEKTVEHHRHRVMVKLQVGSLAELVRLVLLAEGMGENPDSSEGKI